MLAPSFGNQRYQKGMLFAGILYCKIYDVMYNTIDQHFNSDPEKPARIISAVNRVYNYLGYGYNDLEQYEDAPEYKGDAE